MKTSFKLKKVPDLPPQHREYWPDTPQCTYTPDTTSWSIHRYQALKPELKSATCDLCLGLSLRSLLPLHLRGLLWGNHQQQGKWGQRKAAWHTAPSAPPPHLNFSCGQDGILKNMLDSCIQPSSIQSKSVSIWTRQSSNVVSFRFTSLTHFREDSGGAKVPDTGFPDSFSSLVLSASPAHTWV